MGLVEFYLFLDTLRQDEYSSWICFLNPVIKIRCLLLLIPNIPLLQHSIIPAGIYGRLHLSMMVPKSGLLDPDIYWVVPMTPSTNQVMPNNSLSSAAAPFAIRSLPD
jgi:hypothetical protein